MDLSRTRISVVVAAPVLTNTTTRTIPAQTLANMLVLHQSTCWEASTARRKRFKSLLSTSLEKLVFQWLREEHVVSGLGSSELLPVDESVLKAGKYLHRYSLQEDGSVGYIVEYKKHAPSFKNGQNQPGVYVYFYNRSYSSSDLLMTEAPREDTYGGIAPVALGIPRLIDKHRNLYLTVHSLGESAIVTLERREPSVVAGTTFGDILLSRNGGLTWEKATLPSPSGVVQITYGNGRFVATGGSGSLWTSTDPTHWEHVQVGSQNWFGATTCGGTHYVAGEGGNVASSIDGKHWTASVPFDTNSLIRGTCANGKAVFVGFRGKTISTLHEGPDSGWTMNAVSPSTDLLSTAYGDGVLVAVGAFGVILRSDDGLEWTSVQWPEKTYFKGVTYGDGRFVAVGHGSAVAVSDDGGRTWQKQNFPIADDYLLSVLYLPGSKRFVVGATSGKVWLSDDRGTSWTVVKADPRHGNIAGLTLGP
jgi:photosystem II stability/assembly factor-like uncharacterized protein